MRKWRSSAAYRIAFAYAATYALGAALVGIIIFLMMRVSIDRQLDSMVSDEAHSLAAQYHSLGYRELSESIAEGMSSQSATRMLYAVYAPDGRRIEGSFTAPRPSTPGIQNLSFIDKREGPDNARGIALDLSPDIRLVVAVDSDSSEHIEDTVMVVFGAAFLGSCLLGLAGALLLGAYLERRLRSISRTAEGIIGGDIRQRMPVGPRRDEFDQLAATLNRMLDRIEGLLENLKQVSSDIAHDLRTPLARLRSRLEEEALDRLPDGVDPVLEDAIKRVDAVLSLFAAILRIAEVESAETRRYFAAVDLTALVLELAESFAPSFEDADRTLLWSTEPGIVLDGDRELLAQAIINLLENAQNHTQNGAVVRLTLVKTGSSACVAVVDNGPGVPTCDLHRITNRFIRLDASRNTSGHGLGLSLVSAVAKLHHGRLQIRNARPGLSVSVELPLTQCTSHAGEGADGSIGEENHDDRPRIARQAPTKVPAVTLGFRLTKILATTLARPAAGLHCVEPKLLV